MPGTHEDNVAKTYLALRLGMVLLVGLLFLSVVFQWISTDFSCLQTSISAYYYTPARPVFVAVLCGIGACLIVYRGNTDTENVLLDFSGFLAFVVAFVPVPTNTANLCDATNVPSTEEISSALRNNVWMLLVTGVIATAVGWLIVKRLMPGTRQPLTTYAKGALTVSFVALVAGMVFLARWPDEFRENGHMTAAITMFVGIVVVVGVNAYGFAHKPPPTSGQRPMNWYLFVAVAMVVSAAGIFAASKLLDNFDHWVFVIEAVLIAEFAVFWLIQTLELRGDAVREQTGSSRF